MSKQNSLCSSFFKVLFNVAIQVLSIFLPASTIDLIKAFVATLPRDLRFVYSFVKIFLLTIFYGKFNTNVIDLFDQNARLYPNKACIVHEGSEWSFKEVEMYSRRVAQAFKDRLVKGDVVGLLMTGRAQYAPIWLGLGRIGVITALFNTNQRNKPLIHSIKTAKPKVIIFSPDMAQNLAEIKDEIDSEIELSCLGKTSSSLDCTDLQELLANSDPDYSLGPKINYTDVLMYIYTSGSTGLPKAALIPHCRFLIVTSLTRHICNITSNDTIYTPLPLYHGSGGVIGIGVAFVIGGTTVVKDKFSASSYFKDCIKYNCTVGQYIGETARYMLASPSSPEDKLHSVRLLLGNGLQPEVWKQLYSRFNIPDIYELYGSSEGTVTLINPENKVGSCGFIPRFIPFLRRLMGIYLIKVDSNGEAVRDKNGLCVLCDIKEPGLAIGMLTKGSNIKKFYGYANNDGNAKKCYVADVFTKGDLAFSSGDIMVQDKYGYFYFKDRLGDTFRWKGENVATTEVEFVLRGFPGVSECTVYGVQVPGNEGRAGMASIVDPSYQIKLSDLAIYFEKSLPKYAQPLFVRLVQSLEYTSTYKAKKFNLQQQGFDPNLTKDPLFYKVKSDYNLITSQIHDDIINGKIHF